MWSCCEAGNREQGTGNGNFRTLSILGEMKDSIQKRCVQVACVVIGPAESAAGIPSFPVPCSPFLTLH